MVLEITYMERKKAIIQNLNIDLESYNLGMYFITLKKNLRKIKSISSAYFRDFHSTEDYSLLEDPKLIDEVLLLLSSICHKFSLVIKQEYDGNKKIIIHYLHGSYNYTEITIGDRTYSYYMPIDKSIEFAEQLFNNVIV